MRKARILLGLLLAVGVWLVLGWRPLTGRRNTQIATIDWADVHQTIDGFGASAADFVSPLPSNLADFFFTTTSGIGLSILRLNINPDLADCQAFATYMSYPTSDCITVSSGATTYSGEPGTAQEAVARGVTTIFASCWSPPGSMKSNGLWYSGGSLVGNSGNYATYAVALASYSAFMTSYGVPVYAISPQNEPDISRDYPSATWTAQQFHDFIPYLHSALQSSGAESTKIMIAEKSSWAIDLTSTTMADPNVALDVGIIAAHGYSGRIQPYGTGRARLWQTEDSSLSSTYDGSITDGMRWAEKIHDYLAVANVNAWVWWSLSDMPGNGNGTDNGALTDINGNFPKRAYVTGQWSKFVRPGWSRIGVEYSGSLRFTAFKEPEGRSFAIVAINSSFNSVPQTFSLNGFTANSVTPWITSASLSLAAQTPVSVGSAGFTYTLLKRSVTTFSGTFVKAVASTK